MAFIAAPVAAWAIGAGASAAAGAILGAVAVGVVSGAVIGAATAAISGGDILEGALKGAVFGGISGGVMSGLGIAMGFSSATSQLANMGLSATGTALPATGASAALTTSALTGPEAGLVPSTLASPTVGGAGYGAGLTAPQEAVAVTTPVNSTVSAVTPTPDDRGFFNKLMFDKEGALNSGVGKVIAGGVESAAKALLADDEETETQSEYLQKVQSMNVVGEFQARTANIQIPTSWQNYNRVSVAPQAQSTSAKLTAEQLAALTNKQSQGVSYAQPA